MQGGGVDADQGRASARSEADRPQGSGRKAKEARGLTGINGGTGEEPAAPASPFDPNDSEFRDYLCGVLPPIALAPHMGDLGGVWGSWNAAIAAGRR